MNPPRPLHLRLGARSEVGPRRRNNQDSGYAGDRAALIADGVGGAPAGDLASATIVRTLPAQLPASGECTPARLREAVAITNAALRNLTDDDPDLQGMATTLTGLVLGVGHGFVVHVGDSRGYRLRDGQLEQVTTDQSWVQLLVEQQMISLDEARTHPMRNLLMHSLSGALRDPEGVHIIPVDLGPGDRWVLATDGLSDYLPADVLATLVASTAQPQDLAEVLVDACYQSSRDNISVVIADVAVGPATGAGRYIGAARTLGESAVRAG